MTETDEPRPPGPMLIRGLVLLLSVIWGSTWLVIAEGLEDMPPLTSAGMRFVLAFLVMLVLAPMIHRREGGEKPRPLLWISVGSLNFAASYGIVYSTETVLPSGLVAVLWASFPLMMALASGWFLDEKLRRTQIFGFVLGFVGIAALFFTDLQAFGPEAIPWALILLLSPFVSVIGQVVIKRGGNKTSSALMTRNAMGLGAVILLGAALAFERDASINWTAGAVGSIVYLALIGTCLTFGLFFWLLRYASASKLSVIAYLAPMIALALGWAVGGEEITGTILAGSGLVILGVILVGL